MYSGRGLAVAGDLATISQGDGQIVFASHFLTSKHLHLTVLNVTDNKPGNLPPIDGLGVATSDNGTLYVVDNKAGTIKAFDTSGCTTGTIFVGEPNESLGADFVSLKTRKEVVYWSARRTPPFGLPGTGYETTAATLKGPFKSTFEMLP